jgi:hypothetical protein
MKDTPLFDLFIEGLKEHKYEIEKALRENQWEWFRFSCEIQFFKYLNTRNQDKEEDAINIANGELVIKGGNELLRY